MNKLKALKEFLVGIAIIYFKGAKRKEVLRYVEWLAQIETISKDLNRRGPTKVKGFKGSVYILTENEYKKLRGN